MNFGRKCRRKPGPKPDASPIGTSERCRCTSCAPHAHLTQQQLAKTLEMTQAAVSQLEQRTDIYLSTLENFVEAMGGRLEMYAVFPDGKVKLGLEREAS